MPFIPFNPPTPTHWFLFTVDLAKLLSTWIHTFQDMDLLTSDSELVMGNNLETSETQRALTLADFYSLIRLALVRLISMLSLC